MNIFYVSIQRYQQTPTTKTKKRPTWAPEFPNLGHAFQAIVQLPELSMVDRMLMDPINRRLLSLQGNTPEVETSSAPENNHRNRKRSFFFSSFFPIFSGEKMSFIHKINMFHCFQLNNDCWKSDHFRDLRNRKTSLKSFSTVKSGPFHLPPYLQHFFKKNDTHHRPPRLDVLNQVAGRWSCHPPRSRFHCRPSQQSPSLAQSSGYLGWMIRRDWWKPMESWNAENACFFVLYGNKS